MLDRERCFELGLKKEAERVFINSGVSEFGMRILLQNIAIDILEGAIESKKMARQRLKRIMAAGVCEMRKELHAHEVAQGARSICGNPLIAEPCTNPNEAECGDCLALTPVEGATANPQWSACLEMMGASKQIPRETA